MDEEKVSLAKIPPNDVVAEQAVLGSMLVDPEAAIKAIELLQPEDFYRDDNKEVYAAMLELFGRGKPIDFLTVKENLKLRGTLEKVGADMARLVRVKIVRGILWVCTKPRGR